MSDRPRGRTVIAPVVVAVVVAAVVVLRPDRLTVDKASEAIAKDVPAARVAAGPRVEGARLLVVHVARKGMAADVLVTVGDTASDPRDALLAAERRAGRGWGSEVSCKNYAVAYRFSRPDPDGDAYAMALPVESAVNRATPDGERDCQG
ncbi:MAG TPA: hypothetical protein VI318_06170 [Baekduia sp.]